MKYKVGDKVRIRRDLNAEEYYGGTGINKEMIKYTGKIMTIREITRNAFYKMNEDKHEDKTLYSSGWSWTDEMIEGLAEPEKIEIFRSKNTTICLQKNDGKVIRKGVAKCHPDDTYHFNLGAEIAFARMMGLPTEEMFTREYSRPRAINGKFKNNDLVRITDSRKQHSMYDKFVEEIAPEYCLHFESGKLISYEECRGAIFKIITQHQHIDRPQAGILLIIQNVQTESVYIIHEDGVKLLNLETAA